MSGIIGLAGYGRGEIFLAQMWQSGKYARQTRGGPSRMAELYAMLVGLDPRALQTDANGDVCIDKAIMLPIIWKNPELYRFQYNDSVDTNADIVTVCSRDKFISILHDGISEYLKDRPGEFENVFRDLSLNDIDKSKRIGYREAALPGARYGEIDTLWITERQSITTFVGDIFGGDRTNSKHTSSVRNALGLFHLSTAELVVLTFRPGALNRHLAKMRSGDIPELAARPYFYDGADNARFWQFDTRSSKGWNFSVNLEKLAANAPPFEGASELITTSISCDEVADFIYLPKPDNVCPCLTKSSRDIVASLSGGKSIDAIIDELTAQWR